ncbi:3'-5' exonuclease family protein [Bifidobacterium eulemuris]|uniref:Ribonuclease n=1 Tax=Bifidobacterium eulemuris TaxID=1765219 RepID=A0A261G9Z5_9BIFI|nr:hypothetical protein [Bifidobacterium eulemuris]OZG68239.1 ribonuclease [Bifidobacterium eulemuris]QOL31705.1 hypothetical protein BE0216_03930 [Bifidobacterium eulemuris]
MNERDKPERLLWLDVETSGLNPAKHQLLEVGMTVTDMQGNRVEHKADYRAVLNIPKWKVGLDGDNFSLWALRAHMGNGLIDESLEQGKTLVSVASDARMWLSGHAGETLHPAGTNVQFDLDWLKPTGILDNVKLSHRRLDVTAFRLADIALERDPYNDAHHTTHRVSDCIERDLRDYRHYLEALGER